MKRLSPAVRKSGFTLVELLVVIGIIVILMGLLLAVVPAVQNSSRNLEAKNVANQVVVAANSYYTEYAKFPPLVPAGSEVPEPEKDQWVGDSDAGAKLHTNALFFTLRNIAKGPNTNNDANPRRVSYLDVKSAKVSDAGKPRGGFFDRTESGGTPPQDVEGCLYDPWGKEYGVMMDTTGDERINFDGIYSDYTGADSSTGKAPRKKVGAFSMGKDNQLGTKGDQTYKKSSEKSDDVVTWD